MVVTCEHGDHQVPQDLAALFPDSGELRSHRGYDRGARQLAEMLGRRLGTPAIIGRTSRLVVDLNRSIGHPNLFSRRIRDLPQSARKRLLAEHYFPYRERVESAVRDTIQRRGRAVHLSIHSFTPSLDGKQRNAEIGLLYDSKRKPEHRICQLLKQGILRHCHGYRIRMNYPYLGKADGLTSSLRKRFDLELYIGIEIEVNQALVTHDWRSRAASLTDGITEAILAIPASTDPLS